MGNLADLVGGAGKIVSVGLLGTFLYGMVSCATMTEAQKTSLAGDALSILGEIDIASSKTKEDRFVNDLLTISGGVVSRQSQMQHDLEVARAGKNEIVINNNIPAPQNKNTSNYQNQNYNPNYDPQINLTNSGISKYDEELEKLVSSPDLVEILNNPTSQEEKLILYGFKRGLTNGTYSSEKRQEINEYLNRLNNMPPPGLFVYKKWVDFNNDGLTDKSELIGLNESVYDFKDLTYLFLSFFGRERCCNGTNLDFKIYNMNSGEIVGSSNVEYNSFPNIRTFICAPNQFPESGKYKVVLNTSNNKTFSIDFEIIK